MVWLQKIIDRGSDIEHNFCYLEKFMILNCVMIHNWFVYLYCLTDYLKRTVKKIFQNCGIKNQY